MFILILIYVCYILGVDVLKATVWEGDLNDITETSFHTIVSTTQHAPTMYGNVLTMRNPNNSDRFQICGGHGSNNVYVRGSDGNNWVDWQLLSYGVPDFYKNYQNLGSLASALGDSYLEIAQNSFSSLQGKNCVFRWINDLVSTPFDANYITIMGRCTTSLPDIQYTMIDVWHVATPSIIYHGMMNNGSVAAWYQYDLQQV